MYDIQIMNSVKMTSNQMKNIWKIMFQTWLSQITSQHVPAFTSNKCNNAAKVEYYTWRLNVVMNKCLRQNILNEGSFKYF